MMVVRIATFEPGQVAALQRGLVEQQLLPRLRTVPGYIGIYLCRNPKSDGWISLSIWENEQAAVAGEEAMARGAGELPPGTVPRPATVEKYVVEYRDMQAVSFT
jgi:heme-degrading monooxygenase HmoA